MSFYILQEDNVGHILLEDSSGALVTEDFVPDAPLPELVMAPRTY